MIIVKSSSSLLLLSLLLSSLISFSVSLSFVACSRCAQFECGLSLLSPLAFSLCLIVCWCLLWFCFAVNHLLYLFYLAQAIGVALSIERAIVVRLCRYCNPFKRPPVPVCTSDSLPGALCKSALRDRVVIDWNAICSHCELVAPFLGTVQAKLASLRHNNSQ